MSNHRAPGRSGDGGSTVGMSRQAPIEIGRFTGIAGVVGSWLLYCEAFADVNSRAAQRHLMTREEFSDVMSDTRISKYVARRGGKLVGLAVMTSDLEAWPLVAKEFYEARYPGRALFYIGFVAAGTGELAAFPMLIAKMYEEVIERDGVALMDFCDDNIKTLNIIDKVSTLLRRINPRAQGGEIDRQVFGAWDFRGEV